MFQYHKKTPSPVDPDMFKQKRRTLPNSKTTSNKFNPNYPIRPRVKIALPLLADDEENQEADAPGLLAHLEHQLNALCGQEQSSIDERRYYFKIMELFRKVVKVNFVIFAAEIWRK
jgi:hypothetical protein